MCTQDKIVIVIGLVIYVLGSIYVGLLFASSFGALVGVGITLIMTVIAGVAVGQLIAQRLLP